MFKRRREKVCVCVCGRGREALIAGPFTDGSSTIGMNLRCNLVNSHLKMDTILNPSTANASLTLVTREQINLVHPCW